MCKQQKNYKNFMNLCSHKVDFGLSADWVFFATSHVKSPCEGIGETVKRLVRRESLHHSINSQIMIKCFSTSDWVMFPELF